MSTMNCPYCKSDQGAQFEEIPKEITSRYRACLCAECGEPLIIDNGFRKPTADEFVMLVEKSPLNEVRNAWLENKRRTMDGEGPPIQALWRKFSESPLARNAPPAAATHLRVLFYGICGVMFFYLKRLLEEKNADEVGATAMLIEAELAVFKEEVEKVRDRGTKNDAGNGKIN